MTGYIPEEKISEYASKDSVKMFIDVEMNSGQMLEDVKLSVCGKKPVDYYGRLGGIVPSPAEIYDFIKEKIK